MHQDLSVMRLKPWERLLLSFETEITWEFWEANSFLTWWDEASVISTCLSRLIFSHFYGEIQFQNCKKIIFCEYSYVYWTCWPWYRTQSCLLGWDSALLHGLVLNHPLSPFSAASGYSFCCKWAERGLFLTWSIFINQWRNQSKCHYVYRYKARVWSPGNLITSGLLCWVVSVMFL